MTLHHHFTKLHSRIKTGICILNTQIIDVLLKKNYFESFEKKLPLSSSLLVQITNGDIFEKAKHPVSEEVSL